MELYVNVDQPSAMLPWLFGRIGRPEVESLMRENGNSEGLFLVRESTRIAGSYVLSVIALGALEHYVIKAEQGLFQIEDGPKFTSLEDLIKHYHQKDERLPTVLRNYCQNKQSTNPDNGNAYEGIWDAKCTAQAKLTQSSSLRTQQSLTNGMPTQQMSNMSMSSQAPLIQPGVPYATSEQAQTMATSYQPPQTTSAPRRTSNDDSDRDFTKIGRVKKWIDKGAEIDNINVKVTDTLKRKQLEGIGDAHSETSQKLFDRFDKAARAEEKLYVMWVNNKLKPIGKSIEDLGPSLTDGVVVIEVIKTICDLKPPVYSKRPKAVVQQVDNWHVVLKYMAKLGIPVDPQPEEESSGLDAKTLHEGERREMLKLFSRLMLYEAHHPRK